MGANCCVAVKEKKLPNTARSEVSANRNVRHSPSWSFHRDNRTHTEEIIDNHSQCSHPNTENFDSESKSDLTAETEGHLGAGIPMHHAQKKWKSSLKSGHLGKQKIFSGDQAIGSVFKIQENDSAKSPCIASASNAKLADRCRSNAQQSTHLSPDQRTCRICSKLLKEISPWSSQKLPFTNELAVVAILVCGHAYHAECLESMTPETDKFDPPCPICFNGEKFAAKIFGKLKTRPKNKLSRIAVADINVDEDDFFDQQEGANKGARMGASSSLKGSLAGPFLRRYFSTGRPSESESESVLESESSKKRGFWARCQRE